MVSPAAFLFPSISHLREGRWARRKSCPRLFCVCCLEKTCENGVFSPMKSHKHETNAPPLWRNHNYLLLQGGQIVSSIGTQQQFIALSLLVLTLTGPVVQTGIVGSLNTITGLAATPLAAAFVAKLNLKWTILIVDVGRMSLTLTILLAL